jgi:hypothetical protein
MSCPHGLSDVRRRRADPLARWSAKASAYAIANRFNSTRSAALKSIFSPLA